MRERTLRRVSRTNPRNASVRRNRRGRWMGKDMVSIQTVISRGFRFPKVPTFASDSATRNWLSWRKRSQVVILVLNIDRKTAEIIADLTD